MNYRKRHLPMALIYYYVGLAWDRVILNGVKNPIPLGCFSSALLKTGCFNQQDMGKALIWLRLGSLCRDESEWGQTIQIGKRQLRDV